MNITLNLRDNNHIFCNNEQKSTRPNGRHDYSLYFVENGVVYFDKITKVEDEVVCDSSDQSSAAASLAREGIAFLYALSYNRDVRKSAG